ncbi:hypothetical protein C1646_672364 [Rhizophagus diaphanus]|nr:hypothetical protein C1646_672364 [Rhizophagus diaphanus] [Rhizophagus sp. MUCL 43196]
MAEFDIKISNEVTTCLSEINASFTAELGRINTELNNKLTAEIEIFKARDTDYVTEAQKTLGRLNNIEEACHNDFGSNRSLVESVTSRFMSINVVIEDFQNKINQHYAVIQRSDFDQLSVSKLIRPTNLKLIREALQLIHLQALRAKNLQISFL